MYSLFISTHDEYVIVGILKLGKLLLIREEKSDRSHSTVLMPIIENVLKQNNIEVSDLNEIIVVNGPGSFTGVRLGVTVAKILAYTLNIPIKTITSIEALAVSNNISDRKVIAIDDIKGTYYGIFENNVLLEEIKYLNGSLFNEFSANEKNVIKSRFLDLEKIYKHLEDKSRINVHNVKPIYIKMIEALNGK